MPFDSWRLLAQRLEENELFGAWHYGSTDAVGKPSSPIELLSLGALRYIGRKCTFDCLEEITFIRERTYEHFFNAFIKYGSTILYDEFVAAPQTPEEAEHHTHKMRKAGFDGGIGSMDATHVTIENCRFGLRQVHLGHKLNKTARTSNIIVNHRRRILSSTGGHPSTWNDKTLVMFDSFLTDVRKGKILSDNLFELLQRSKKGKIVRVQYNGVWLQVDNGYHEWSITMPPFKYVSNRNELRWSQWMESMRKDVECTFGILKKRWTILSKGIKAKDISIADEVWKTCCALHNMLLEVDGYDEMWQEDVSTTETGDSCFAINRLVNGEDEMVQSTNAASIDYSAFAASNTSRNVRDMTFHEMRSRLVDHFNIRFHLVE